MINILYAGNSKVFNGLLLSAISLTEKTRNDMTIYVITMDLTEKSPAFTPISEPMIEALKRAVTRYNPNNRVIKIDATEIYNNVMADTKNNKSLFTPYAMLRLLITYFDNIPDKILYLDTDTIINNDVQELFDTDISQYEVGVIRDIRIRNHTYDKNYFNSGVMLMNVTELRKTKGLEKAIEILRHRKLLLADQTSLNWALTKKLLLDRKYNEFSHICKYYPEIVIHHMCNARKKWNIFKRIKPWHREDFLKVFPMYSYIYEQFDKIMEDNKNSIS